MISLIHLLEHWGLPSGVAIVVVIGARKLLFGGISRMMPRDRTGRGPDDQSR